jgi:glycosyltransferase involved in cell wall biosynthesis
MTKPAVTVAMPMYNKARFVVATVQSALAQTFTDFEIMVVDDGSNDGSAERLTALAEPKLTVIRQQNAGVAAARTRAMREGQGPYVAFLDADDLWHPDHLSHLMELTRRYPEADLLGNNYAECPAQGASFAWEYPAPHYRLMGDYFSECATSRAPFYTSSCMVRRERALQAGGFPLGNNCGEDLALWMRLAECAPVAVSDFVGCLYRRGIDSLSLNPSYRNATDVSMLTLLDILNRHADWPEKRKASLQEYHSRLALAHCLDCLRAGETDQARRYLTPAAGTRLMRRRLWQARFLSILPASLREVSFRLFEQRHSRRST